MRLIGTFCFLTLLSLVSSCRAHVHSYRVDGPKSIEGKQGVYYSLPLTVIVASVPISLTTIAPGDFSKFAAAFFPTRAGEITTDKTSTFKPAAATITSSAIADPDNVFLIRLNPENAAKFWHWFDSHSYDVTLGPQGVMNSLKAEAENQFGPALLELTKSAASVFGQVLSGGTASVAKAKNAIASASKQTSCSFVGDMDTSEVAYYGDTSRSEELRYLYCMADHEGRTAIQIIAARGWTEPFLIYFQKYKADMRIKDAKDDLAGFMSAGVIYDQLIALVANRNTLLGQLSQVQTADVLKAALDRLDSDINDVSSGFFGVQKSDPAYWAGTFAIIPKGKKDGNPYEHFGAAGGCSEEETTKCLMTLFSYSPSEGICEGTPEKSDLFTVVRIQKVPTVKCAKAGEIRRVVVEMIPLTLSQNASVIAAAQKTSSLLAKADNGIYVRVPANASFTVSRYNKDVLEKVLAASDQQVSQFGPVMALPSSTGGPKVTYSLDTYPDSGAIKNVVVTRTAVIDTASISSLTAAGVSSLKAKQDAQAAAQPPSDAAKLQKQLLQQMLQQCLADSSLSFCAALVK
jgi:hypothetical protein